MADQFLLKGNEAIAEAAIRAGVDVYAGYPITPQNEITAYMAANMIKEGRHFIQAESEVAAINICYGVSAAGGRTMTSSSSPGISLKQEGISYCAGAELPIFFVNMIRGGPGLGNIAPAQSDYFQSTRGGGHGDYRVLVYAPNTVQEAVNLTMLAIDKADEYRIPAMIQGDGIIGQISEPCTFPSREGYVRPAKPWALGPQNGSGRVKNVANSLILSTAGLEEHNLRLEAKHKQIEAAEVMFDEFETGDAEVILVAYGTTSRICKEAVRMARKTGFKLGLFRPITLWPYPMKELGRLAGPGRAFMSVEMSLGQMVDDVKIAINGRSPVGFYGRTGGAVPESAAIIAEARKLVA